MKLEQKVIQAQTQQKICDQLIREYYSFIVSCASKATGRFVTSHDDELSIALIAFHEAIQKYEEKKGNFISFATLMIRNRIIDYIRKEAKTSDTMPFSSLCQNNYYGDEIEFDIEDTVTVDDTIRYEVETLTKELEDYNITFFELARVSPKSKKTKLACFQAISFVLSRPILIAELKNNDTLPIKSIVEHIGINRKVVERHRKYIIAGLIVLSGNYEVMAQYFEGVKEVMI